jgi:hypothetical protein
MLWMGREAFRSNPLSFKIRDQLPINLVLYNQTMKVKESLDLGLPRVGGCISADGAFESHTAALFEEVRPHGRLTQLSQDCSAEYPQSNLINTTIMADLVFPGYTDVSPLIGI